LYLSTDGYRYYFMKIHGIIGNDWEAIYIDGKLAAEGHSVRWRDLADALGAEVTQSDAIETKEGDWNPPKVWPT